MVRFIRGLTAVAALCLILPARAPGDDPKPQSADREERNVDDRREEARLNVELLNLELETEKAQLRQQLQVLKQQEFGLGLMVGRGGFGGRRNPPDSDEEKKALASLHERYERLKAETVETSKKLGQAQRLLAELDRGHDGVAASPNPGHVHEGAKAEPSRRDHLIYVGHYLINTRRITYAQPWANGLLRINFANKESIVLNAEEAKTFFERIGLEGR
jgi:hypothetical protein